MLRDLLRRATPPLLLDATAALRIRRRSRRLQPLCAGHADLAGSESGRCFVIGSGPSLKDLDLARLAGRAVIAINNLVAHPAYAAIAPRHHVIAPIHPPQDEAQWTEWLRSLDAAMVPGAHLWCGVRDEPLSALALARTNGLFTRQRIHPMPVLPRDRGMPRIPDRFDRPIPGADTCSIYAIALALWLGYREIVVLGLDHNYFMFDDPAAQRFYGVAPHQRGEDAAVAERRSCADEFQVLAGIFAAYEELLMRARGLGGIVVNAGDATVNKAFPRRSFADCLAPEPLSPRAAPG